ncbi:MAG: putative leucine rich repeat protein, partial [Streblomastix strix]
MVSTTAGGLELARATLCDDEQNVVFDSLCVPDEQIIDYHTLYSGITEEMMNIEKKNRRSEEEGGIIQTECTVICSEKYAQIMKINQEETIQVNQSVNQTSNDGDAIQMDNMFMEIDLETNIENQKENEFDKDEETGIIEIDGNNNINELNHNLTSQLSSSQYSKSSLLKFGSLSIVKQANNDTTIVYEAMRSILSHERKRQLFQSSQSQLYNQLHFIFLRLDGWLQPLGNQSDTNTNTENIEKKKSSASQKSKQTSKSAYFTQLTPTLPSQQQYDQLDGLIMTLFQALPKDGILILMCGPCPSAPPLSFQDKICIQMSQIVEEQPFEQIPQESHLKNAEETTNTSNGEILSKKDSVEILKENEAQEVEQIQLFVWNLSENTTEEQLEEHFTIIGTVESVFIPVSRFQNRGFGFVTMKDDDDVVQNGIEDLQMSELCGSNISIIAIHNMPRYTKGEISYSFAIEKIIMSNKLSDSEKIEKLDQLNQQLKKENIYKLLIQFDRDAFSVIKDNLNDLSTPQEHALLNMVVLVIDHISQIMDDDDQFSDENSIQFIDLQNSGIIAKIEEILQQRFKSEQAKKDLPFSQLTEQLIRIYLQMNRQKLIQNNILDICSQVIATNIQHLVEIDSGVNDFDAMNILGIIGNFMKFLQYGRYFEAEEFENQQFKQFEPQRELIIESYEQMEQQGGLEEIEIHQTNEMSLETDRFEAVRQLMSATALNSGIGGISDTSSSSMAIREKTDETINLSNRLITQLPRVMSSRKDQKITILNVSYNLLQTLPVLTTSYPDIEILLAENNHFKVLPATLSNSLTMEKINMNVNQINQFPHIYLPKFTELQLKYNKLITVPHDLGLLYPKLELIMLQSNRLATLPRVNNNSLLRIEAEQNFIRCLTTQMYAPKLEVLSLSSNEFEQFALPFGSQLNKIEFLDLRMNMIKEIPRNTFQQLSSLRTLMLTHNQIEFLPNDLGDIIPKLRDLWIGENKLREVPKKVLMNDELFSLYCSNNYLTYCPPVLSKSQQGIKLNLSNNLLHSAPVVGPDVDTIYAERNMIFHFPELIGGSKRDEILQLEKEKEKQKEKEKEQEQDRENDNDYPSVLNLSPSLYLKQQQQQIQNQNENKEDNNYDNQKQEQQIIEKQEKQDKQPFKTQMSNYKKLRILSLRFNHLRHIPNTLYQADLNVLLLSGNQMNFLNNELMGKWTRLRVLDLSFNQLTTVPQGIKSMYYLLRLQLAFNKIKEIPVWLFGMKHLHYLVVCGNQIEKLPSEEEVAVYILEKQGILQIIEEKDDDESDIIARYEKEEELAVDGAEGSISKDKTNTDDDNQQQQQQQQQQQNIYSSDQDRISPPQFIHINLSSNRIKKFPRLLLRFKSLNFVNISNNLIQKLPYSLFVRLPNMNRFECSFNRLRDISNVIFPNKYTGVSFDVAHNEIRYLPPYLMPSQQQPPSKDDFFSERPPIQHVDISFN